MWVSINVYLQKIMAFVKAYRFTYAHFFICKYNYSVYVANVNISLPCWGSPDHKPRQAHVWCRTWNLHRWEWFCRGSCQPSQRNIGNTWRSGPRLLGMTSRRVYHCPVSPGRRDKSRKKYFVTTSVLKTGNIKTAVAEHHIFLT